MAQCSVYSGYSLSVNEHDCGSKRGSSRAVDEDREISRILNTTNMVRSRGIVQVEGAHQVNLQSEKPAGEKSDHHLLGGKRSPRH